MLEYGLERLSMERSTASRNLMIIRERRMWTQARLADEAGVSPTTVSGIESGRISRPHFGTLRKLAQALGVEPEELLSLPRFEESEVPSPLSLEWAMSSGEEEFERGLEEAPIERLNLLFRELGEEQGRLRRLYGEARGSEQRRLIKTMIRQVAANSGSVEASITAQNDKPPEHSPERRSPQDENPDTQGPSA
jgi:transcriptional regulator with XRE-family HTH domain